MRVATCLMLLGTLLCGVSDAARSEDAGQSRDAVARQQWNLRTRQQLDRLDASRREGRPFLAPETDAQLAEGRVREAFDDPSLAPGDLIVTPKGLYRYRGSPMDRERQPGDFSFVARPQGPR